MESQNMTFLYRNRACLAVSTVISKSKDFLRSQAVTYTIGSKSKRVRNIGTAVVDHY